MARIRHNGGEMAEAGNYWNFSTGERITFEGKGVLPGSASTTYYKAHPVLILAAGPALGLVYAVFLPFIGLAIIGKMIVMKLLGRTAEDLSRAATFNWRPAESYLAGRDSSKKDEKGEDSSPSSDGDSPGSGK